MALLLKAFLLWLPMIPLAIANGLARESLLARRMSPLKAHQVSSLTGSALLLVYILFLHRALPFSSPGQAWACGLIWLGLTMAFEFGFGRFAAKHSWKNLLADYNIFRGKLWVLVLATVAIGPRFAYWLGV